MRRVYSFDTEGCNAEGRFFDSDKLVGEIIPKLGGECFLHSQRSCDTIYLLPLGCVGNNFFGTSKFMIGSNSLKNIEKIVKRINEELERRPNYYEHHKLLFHGIYYHDGIYDYDDKGKGMRNK